jgi:hypothetical protein
MDPRTAAMFGLAGAVLGLLGAILAIVALRRARAAIWGPLCARFPSVGTDTSGETRFRTLVVRFHPLAHLRFGCCTALKISDRSVGIRIQFPVGIIFRPVDLPWSAVERVELKRSFFGYPLAIVTVEHYSPVLIFSFMAGQLIHDKWARHGPGKPGQIRP